MKIHRRATVSRNEFDEIADLEMAGAIDCLQASVFLGKGMALEKAQALWIPAHIDSLLGRQAYIGHAMFGCYTLEPRVRDHLVFCRATRDGGQDRQGMLEAKIKPSIGSIHEGVGSGLHFCHCVVCRGDVVVARGGGADDLHCNACLTNSGDTGTQALQAFVGACLASFLVFQIDNVPLVSHDASESQVFRIGRLTAQLDYVGRVGIHTTSIVANIDFHQYARLHTGRCRRLLEVLEVIRMIDGDHDVAAPSQCHQTFDLATTDDLIGNQDVIDSGVCHHFGFAQFGAGHANGASYHLHIGDGRCFV